MKVFLSWSGERSRKVATVVSEWLCCVIQASRPWISSKDLDRGSLWFGEINDQLKETNVGIIFLTVENKDRPWIIFEAGALAKGLSTSRVCTLLIDLEPKDLVDPLAQFNHTFLKEDSIFSLLKTLNSTMGAATLDSRVLEQIFNTYWPQLEKSLEAILQEVVAAPAKPRAQNEILTEILENTRSLNNRVRRLENGRTLFEPQFDERQLNDHLLLSTDYSGQNTRIQMVVGMMKNGMSDEEIVKEIGPRANTSLLSHARLLCGSL